jgi:putative membrane protein
MYDADAGEVAPFEEFMGSHGGLGGPQTRPFAVFPTEWSDPQEPIVGVQAMHETLATWLTESAGGERSSG